MILPETSGVHLRISLRALVLYLRRFLLGLLDLTWSQRTHDDSHETSKAEIARGEIRLAEHRMSVKVPQWSLSTSSATLVVSTAVSLQRVRLFSGNASVHGMRDDAHLCMYCGTPIALLSRGRRPCG